MTIKNLAYFKFDFSDLYHEITAKRQSAKDAVPEAYGSINQICRNIVELNIEDPAINDAVYRTCAGHVSSPYNKAYYTRLYGGDTIEDCKIHICTYEKYPAFHPDAEVTVALNEAITVRDNAGNVFIEDLRDLGSKCQKFEEVFLMEVAKHFYATSTQDSLDEKTGYEHRICTIGGGNYTYDHDFNQAIHGAPSFDRIKNALLICKDYLGLSERPKSTDAEKLAQSIKYVHDNFDDLYHGNDLDMFFGENQTARFDLDVYSEFSSRIKSTFFDSESAEEMPLIETETSILDLDRMNNPTNFDLSLNPSIDESIESSSASDISVV